MRQTAVYKNAELKHLDRKIYNVNFHLLCQLTCFNQTRCKVNIYVNLLYMNATTNTKALEIAVKSYDIQSHEKVIDYNRLPLWLP